MKNLTTKLAATVFVIAVALSSCTLEETTDFTGTWYVSENNSVLGQSQYTVSISESATNADSVFIQNFNNLGNSESAVGVINGNTITLNPQLVDNLNIAGSGTLSGSTINMSYTVSAGGVQNVTATYTK